MVEKRNVNTAIILIDQKRRRINHKPNARLPLDASSMRNWRRSCEDCQSARLRLETQKQKKKNRRERIVVRRAGRCAGSCIHNIGNGTRTAKIAVDDAVLLHKFSSEISVDKFLAEFLSLTDSVCVRVCVCARRWPMLDSGPLQTARKVSSLF